jgi:hypothetical protein
MVNGLQAYYDAYTNASAAYLSAVPTLTDLGPNGWDAEQSVGGSQPKMLPWTGVNYFHLPNVAGNFLRTSLTDDTYDYTVTYADGTTASGSKATVSGNLDFGVGDTDFHTLQVRRIQVSLSGVPVRDLWADDGNSNSATVADRVSGSWTINRSGANPTRIVSAPAWLLDGTDDFWELPSAALGMLRNVPGATLIGVSNYSSFAGSPYIAAASTAIGATRAAIRFLDVPSYAVLGRRVTGGTTVTISGGTPVANTASVLAGVIRYSNATASVFANGSIVAGPSAFQDPGNTLDNDSQFIRIGSSSTATPTLFAVGTIERLAIYNRALSDAEIRALSRYFAGRTGGAVTV